MRGRDRREPILASSAERRQWRGGLALQSEEGCGMVTEGVAFLDDETRFGRRGARLSGRVPPRTGT
jgi:hypothetical protein